jgi:hypothetical protein
VPERRASVPCRGRMSKKHMTGSHAINATADGPVRIRVIDSGPNFVHCEIGVDYQRAPVPERSYYADYCDVQRARFGFGLFFGKLITGTSRLRTKIEIDFPEDLFGRQLWGTSREMHKLLRTAAAGMNFSPISEVEDTDKVQTFRSNNVFMGIWGEEAVMDFFYLSPRDMAQPQRGVAALEPVIRVVMPTPLLLEFLDKCRPFVENTLQIEVPKAEVV